MGKPISAQIVPAVLFGGIPFYIGAIFWFFPSRMSSLFKFSGSLWPDLSEKIYSPKAMRWMGAGWVIFGIIMWIDILLD